MMNDINCPFCQNEVELIEDTYCCEECGASFKVIQEPQDILIKNIKEHRE